MGQQMVTGSLPDCETLKIDGCAVRKKRVNVGLELAACPTILAATGMLNRHKLPESSSDRDVNIVGLCEMRSVGLIWFGWCSFGLLYI